MTQPHPEMAIILRELAARPVPAYETLPIAEARRTFDAVAAGWNTPLPPVASREPTVGGTPCRLLQPSRAAPGLVIFIHGGGWTFGSPDTHGRFARLLALASARKVLLLDYRLAPEHPCPAALDDVAAVLDGLADDAELKAAASGGLVLCGDSAGANIALAVALGRHGTGIAGLSLLYGCFAPQFENESHATCGDGSFGLSTARMRWFWANWLGAAGDRRGAPLEADLSELARLPRCHLLAAGLDPLRDDSTAMAARLAAAGVPLRLDVIPGVVHGFLQMSSRLAPARDSIALIAAEIRAALE
jgi:acetyl esterase